ncbi:hypothetical protein IFT69_24560 [Pseudomonas putida]|nr:hypothetical protein [Pseudomonas putida]
MQMTTGKLSEYLVATTKVARHHATSPPQLMHMVDEMDALFHREFFSEPLEMAPISAVLAMNAYTAILGAVREALSGHVVLVFPVARTALESACYSLLVSQREVNADVWLNRNRSTSDLKACRKLFTVENTIKILQPIQPEMAEYVRGLYEASIDYGAHPNPLSIMSHFEPIGPQGDDEFGYSLTGVQGHDSWYVNRELLVCVEIGQAIAFLIAASIPDHPLLNERIQDFENWMATKNQMAESLSADPINHAGPMYSSVRPPPR